MWVGGWVSLCVWVEWQVGGCVSKCMGERHLQRWSKNTRTFSTSVGTSERSPPPRAAKRPCLGEGKKGGLGERKKGFWLGKKGVWVREKWGFG